MITSGRVFALKLFSRFELVITVDPVSGLMDYDVRFVAAQHKDIPGDPPVEWVGNPRVSSL